ncbi:Dabb family protein [Halioxenophilus sp. WMMB6]|uniref:Dabb family protein n=1 Tax=Halioxenophilus sp. WMMB6 TaxID=3073815 RepID=UPI00295E5B46|nr:Dabb family protein [Halioxenophilus sp. WMMB6]
MIKHVVLIKLKADYDPQQLQSLIEKLDALIDEVPTLKRFDHGKNAAGEGGKFDYGVVAEFDSMADCQAYLVHPAHQAAGAVLMPLIAEAASMQFEY